MYGEKEERGEVNSSSVECSVKLITVCALKCSMVGCIANEYSEVAVHYSGMQHISVQRIVREYTVVGGML